MISLSLKSTVTGSAWASLPRAQRVATASLSCRVARQKPVSCPATLSKGAATTTSLHQPKYWPKGFSSFFFRSSSFSSCPCWEEAEENCFLTRYGISSLRMDVIDLGRKSGQIWGIWLSKSIGIKNCASKEKLNSFLSGHLGTDRDKKWHEEKQWT